MNQNKKTLLTLFLAFIVLSGISLYRQLSIRHNPGSSLRPILVYAVYIELLIGWQFSIRTRIPQSNFRNYLNASIVIMVLWLTIRFLQDFILYDFPTIMRVSGYFIVIPLVFIPLFGIYAAFCLGQGEVYRIPRVWYLLMIPDILISLMMLTNEYHHFVFRKYSGSELRFPTNVGIIFVLLWAVALILFRMIVIYRKSRNIHEVRFMKFLPFGISIAMPLIVIPYFLNEFAAKSELIELTAKLFFLEALTWESCILLGMVPVNTQYETVFEQSTVAMRIISPEGHTIAGSSHALTLTDEQMKALKNEGYLAHDPDTELRLYELSCGSLIYQNDISEIRKVMDQLNQTAKELEQESILLSRELRTKSEEARIQAKNQIYDRLSREVGSQLSLMTGLMDEESGGQEALFRKICLIGTYIKRRCNLRLTELETSTLPSADLELSLSDMVSCIALTGVRAELRWEEGAEYSPEFSLFIFDTVECLLESHNFAMESIGLASGTDGCFTISVTGEGFTAILPEKAAGWFTSCINLPNGYVLTLGERKVSDV